MGDAITIIAADLAIAIPIAMYSIVMVASGIFGAQSYMQAYSRSAYSEIRYYSISQQMIGILGAVHGNSSEYFSELRNLSGYYNVSASISGLGNYSECDVDFCRISEVNGKTMVLVIK
ncbi:MAG: hypothetical protein ACYCO0_03135 [Candidatus Micrarchaeaceae archaeon]